MDTSKVASVVDPATNEKKKVSVQTTTINHFFSRKTEAEMTKEQSHIVKAIQEAKAAKAARLAELSEEEQIPHLNESSKSAKGRKGQKPSDHEKTRPGTNILDLFAFSGGIKEPKVQVGHTSEAACDSLKSIADGMDSDEEGKAGEAARATAAAIASDDEVEAMETVTGKEVEQRNANSRRRRTIINDSDDDE